MTLYCLLALSQVIANLASHGPALAWGAAHLGFLREHLPYEHGVPGERWLTILMNRINPALFAAAFANWVRETWPKEAEPSSVYIPNSAPATSWTQANSYHSYRS